MKRYVTAICLLVMSAAGFAQSYNITNIHIETETTIEEEKTIYPKHSFLMQDFFFGDEQQAFGLTVGQVKRLGWFANVMLGTGLHFHGDYDSHGANYPFNNYGLIYEKYGLIYENGEYVLPAYSGKASHNMFSLTGGGVVRLFKGTYLYAGIGYGYKSVTWQLKNKEWVEIHKDNNHGAAFSGSFGVIINTKKNISASVGAIVIGDFVGVNLGIGLYKMKTEEPNENQ